MNPITDGWHRIHEFTRGWLWSRGPWTDKTDRVYMGQLLKRGIAFDSWPTLPADVQDAVLADLKLEKDLAKARAAREAPRLRRAQEKYEHAYRERNKHERRKSRRWFKWQAECLRWKRRGAFGHFDEFAVPHIKATFPSLDLNALVAVQPMTRAADRDMVDALAYALTPRTP